MASPPTDILFQIYTMALEIGRWDREGAGEAGREREGICMAMADADGAAEQIALLSVDRSGGGWGRGTQAIFSSERSENTSQSKN